MRTQIDRYAPPRTGTLIADLRLLPKPFYLLVVGSFINRFGHFVVPFLAIYLRQLGFAPAVTGYTLAAYGAGGLRVPTGRFITARGETPGSSPGFLPS